MDGIEHCKGSEEGDWVNDGKDQSFEHCLRRCNSNDVRGMEFENVCKGEQVERDDEFANLERLTPTGLLHAMDEARVSYSPRMNSLDQNTGDFVSMGVEDVHKNELVDPAPGGSFFFENNGKRHIDNVDIDDDDIGRFHQSNQQKRMRCGGLWEEQPPSGFDSYMEQIQYTMRKAKMLYAEKEQACVDDHLQLQYLNEMLEQKDQIIRTLEKTQVEEHQKWQHNLCQYEQELNILAKLVVGYKKALKETQSKFEEYRKKCPQGDKPLYKDVPGAGGLVLTSKEVERLRLQKEEEMCQIAEEMFNAFQCDWFVKFQECHEEVMRLFTRLEDLDGEVKLIGERFVARKSKDT